MKYSIKSFLYTAAFFLFFSVSFVNAGNLWQKLNSPTNVTLRNCSFVDTDNGWAAGDDGVIIHTSDGGSTFEIQNSTITYYINDIFFINKRLGWVVANESFFQGSTILKTTNGGTIWHSETFQDSLVFLKTIYFRDSLNGFLGGFGGKIYKTTDAGNSWVASVIDSSEFSGFPVSRIKFASANTGFAVGGYIDVAGVIWRTSNGGVSWSAEAQSPEPFYDLFTKNPLQIIAVGGDFEYGVQISKTSNAGINWGYQSLGLFGQAQSIDFRTENEAWMPLGFGQAWAFTSNGGISWISIPATDSSELYAVDFADSLHGWAVGRNGIILKYNPMTDIVSSENSAPHSHALLCQNYPNPFNPETIINYELRISGYVELNIYNSVGEKINSLVNKTQPAGNYSFKFNGESLPSGVYFYDLKAGDFYEVKKMLLLK